MPGKALILFDGDCAFCNGWVNWIRDRDKHHLFSYAALSSEVGRRSRERFSVPDTIDSLVLVEEDAAFLKSEAAVRILEYLPHCRTVARLARLVPRPLRDPIYDLVARNRHRLGRKDRCEIPKK